MKRIGKLFCSAVVTALFALAVSIQAQSGGTYSITQSVVASGGTTGSTGGAFKIDGTSGQAIAGTNSTGGASLADGPYLVHGGFWQRPFAPSAAGFSIAGRVTTADGRGIINAILRLTNLNGRNMTARTGSFGYYKFEDVTAGETYVLSIQTKRFTFENATRIISVTDDITDADFTAIELP